MLLDWEGLGERSRVESSGGWSINVRERRKGIPVTVRFCEILSRLRLKAASNNDSVARGCQTHKNRGKIYERTTQLRSARLWMPVLRTRLEYNGNVKSEDLEVLTVNAAKRASVISRACVTTNRYRLIFPDRHSTHRLSKISRSSILFHSVGKDA